MSHRYFLKPNDTLSFMYFLFTLSSMNGNNANIYGVPNAEEKDQMVTQFFHLFGSLGAVPGHGGLRGLLGEGHGDHVVKAVPLILH